MAAEQRYGEIYDRGYQHYTGERQGRVSAVWALARYSMKRALGIKKSWTAKIIPIIVYVAISIPVIVSIGIKAFLPTATPIGYANLFAIAFAILGLYVATIAPEMVCGDRRERVLSLYFARAISRLDYLIGKIVATALLTLTVSLVPAMLYWLFLQLLADKPLQALGDNLPDLGRVIVAGSVIAIYLGTLGLLISSFTGRKSIAVAVIVIGFGVATSLSLALAASIQDKSLTPYLAFLSPSQATAFLTLLLFEPQTAAEETVYGDILPLWQYVAGTALTVAAAIGVMLWRYLPEE